MVIVAAVDRSGRSADVIREAGALGGAFDDPVHVVHVLTPSKFVELGRTSVERNDPIDMDEVREIATEIAKEAAADLDVAHEAKGLVGDPATRIVDYAEDHDARYVIVAGRKRSPAGKVIFGSVSQTVLLNADCPVVSTVKQ